MAAPGFGGSVLASIEAMRPGRVLRSRSIRSMPLLKIEFHFLVPVFFGDASSIMSSSSGMATMIAVAAVGVIGTVCYIYFSKTTDDSGSGSSP